MVENKLPKKMSDRSIGRGDLQGTPRNSLDNGDQNR
jgi:hypothetical protein